MNFSYLGIAIAGGCCWIAGCAAAPKEKKTEVNASEPSVRAVSEPASATANPCEGLPVEVLEEYWEDGSPSTREEVVVVDGEYVAHGTTTHWWENGQKKLEMSFTCGTRDGEKTTWWPTGEIWSRGRSVNGKDDGTWTVWYRNGDKQREFTLNQGVWDGPYRVWHPNGQKKLDFMFVKGLQQGPLKIWNEEGNLISEVDYIDGEEQPMPGGG